MSEAYWRDRAQDWFPALVDKGLRQVTWPAIRVHRDYISAQLAAGHRVHDPSTPGRRAGLVASVASVRRWVGGNLPEEARRAQVRVLRPGPVEPGSEAQIDYGRLGMWTDPATGRRHTVQAFVSWASERSGDRRATWLPGGQIRHIVPPRPDQATHQTGLDGITSRKDDTIGSTTVQETASTVVRFWGADLVWNQADAEMFRKTCRDAFGRVRTIFQREFT